MPATSQEPSGRLPRPGRVRKRRLRSTKRVSARHQVKRPERYSLSRKRSGRRIRYCYWRSSFGADPLYPQSHRPRPGLRFGPDVFADALVPRRRSRPRCFSHRNSEWRSGVSRAHAGRRVLHNRAIGSDGYRFAKPHGKSNSANCAAIQQNSGFSRPLTGAAGPAFRFDSSRCLNCPSNLIGHDHRNKPANGGWVTGWFDGGREPRSETGRQKESKRTTTCFRDTSIRTPP